jgi:peptide/nickel transport system ATP-binding protein
LLSIQDLRTRFLSEEGELFAVDGVSLDVEPGETVGVVGESGCGKSVTALSVLRLIQPPGRIVSGRILLDGVDLLQKSEAEMRRVRGDRVAMIFQEPMTSLNPVFTVGEQIAESLRHHRGASRRDAHARAVDLLRQVGIPAPEDRVDRYPHEMSGGMRQRVMIAMALACDPELLIADEPTTALDVTIQAQILDLLARLRRERGMAVLLISHDLGVIAETCDRVVVMYAGKVVESGPAADVLRAPRHPYTAGLLRSLPGDPGQGRRLATIPGMVPPLTRLPPGCRFRDRCDRALELCARQEPPLASLDPGRAAACHNPVPVPGEEVA